MKYRKAGQMLGIPDSSQGIKKYSKFKSVLWHWCSWHPEWEFARCSSFSAGCIFHHLRATWCRAQNMHKQDKLLQLTYLLKNFLHLTLYKLPPVPTCSFGTVNGCNWLLFWRFCHGTAKLVEKGAATLQGSKLRIESVFNIQLANKSLGKRESRKRNVMSFHNTALFAQRDCKLLGPGPFLLASRIFTGWLFNGSKCAVNKLVLS